MTKSKVALNEASRSTLFGDIHGVGNSALMSLVTAGYKLDSKSTVADFFDETKSIKELEDRFTARGVGGKYLMAKFRKVYEMGDLGPSNEELLAAKTDPLLNPISTKQPAVDGPDTAANPDIVTNVNETPEVLAEENEGDVPAVATGDVAAKQVLAVVPNQLQSVSPDDRTIADPTTQTVETEASITPAAALGSNVAGIAGARNVAPQSLEEHQEQTLELSLEDAVFGMKANFEKDLGDDGRGGAYASDKAIPRGKKEAILDPSVDGLFSLGSLDMSKYQGGGEGEGEEETKAPLPMNGETTSSAGASYHPFKQPLLFANHDRAALHNNPIIEHGILNSVAIDSALRASKRVRMDPSWRRFNAATLGVDSWAMPKAASNYLGNEEGISIPLFQYAGVNPLQPSFSPSPWERSRLAPM